MKITAFETFKVTYEVDDSLYPAQALELARAGVLRPKVMRPLRMQETTSVEVDADGSVSHWFYRYNRRTRAFEWIMDRGEHG